jgi:hypothetical protein
MSGIKKQKHNPYISGKYAHVNKNDVVFTPDWLAKQICEMFEITGKVLEPCKGEGAFLKYLPENTEWCEVTEGKNFYDFASKVDWIITNPPYSDFDRFLDHSFELADNIVLLVPVAKMMKSMGTLKKVFNYGGIVSCHFLGGGQAGFPFGFPVGIYYLKRNYLGKTDFRLLSAIKQQLEYLEEEIKEIKKML